MYDPDDHILILRASGQTVLIIPRAADGEDLFPRLAYIMRLALGLVGEAAETSVIVPTTLPPKYPNGKLD